MTKAMETAHTGKHAARRKVKNARPKAKLAIAPKIELEADYKELIDKKEITEINKIRGYLNSDDETIMNNMSYSMRLGLPQVKVFVENKEVVCLVGGGPSLEQTFEELRDLYFSGAKIVAMNGTYNWLLERNIKPNAFVMMDSREFNERFIGPPINNCKYFLASQCHPKCFDKVKDREAYIMHCTSSGHSFDLLVEDYYGKGNYIIIGGGSTVMLRSIWLFRNLGFQFFEIFGFDSCYMDGKGHSYEQLENDSDEVKTVWCAGEKFMCSSWQVSQASDFKKVIQAHGNKFYLNVHGDGLIAHMVKKAAQFYVEGDE